MSELIKGREVFEVLERGDEVEYKYKGTWLNGQGLRVCEILEDSYEFRLKPRTITINGIEVPACGTDYKQHTFMFVLNSLEPCEYSKIILDESDEIPPYWWQTEDEVKQVITALRKIFSNT